MGPGSSHPLFTTREETGDSRVGASHEDTENHDATTPRESFGIPSICCHQRLSPQSQAQRHGPSLVENCESVTPRPERTYAEAAVQTAPPMVEDQEPVKVYSSEASTSYHYHPHRCLFERMGRPFSSRNCSGVDSEQIRTRDVVAEIPVVSH